MSEDERLSKIKDLLDSTLAEFEAVFKSAGTFDQSRVGNGWTPSTIPVQTLMIEPMPFDQVTRIAESRKARAFGPMRWLRLRWGKIHQTSDPTLVFFPFWRLQGYHECFYFRGKSYTATVPDDVIAIQVGRRIRTLTSQPATRRPFLDRAGAMIKRTLAARNEPRYFTIDGAIELAHQFKEASLVVDGEGRDDITTEYLLEKRPPMHPMEENRELDNQRSSTRFAPLALKAEDAVRILHSKVVKAPTVFNKILTNRFEVTELSLIEIPVYVFNYRYLGREKSLRIHGVTGELLK